MIEFNLTGTAGSFGSGYLFPLFLYPKKDLLNGNKPQKEPNIAKEIYEKLTTVYKKQTTPENIFYYIYGILYSNIYRETYSEYLKIDFPKVPFTSDNKLFGKLSKLGKQLADLHLLKSSLLDKPIAKYHGKSINDKIEKIIYQEKEQRIYINKEKYFEGIKPAVWNYYVGAYQVLHKYLKDRKDRVMDNPKHYILIITALHHTINIQNKIDKIFPEIIKKLITI